MSDTTTTVSINPIEAPPSLPAAPLRPAWKTTEGWINLGTGLIGALVGAHFIGDGGQVATVAGLMLMAIATVSHTASRTALKRAS